VNSLWVHEHRGEARVLVLAVAFAAAASLVPLIVRRRLLPILLAWTSAGFAAGLIYWDRLPIIGRVLFEHAR
jgi:hypothetical protein